MSKASWVVLGVLAAFAVSESIKPTPPRRDDCVLVQHLCSIDPDTGAPVNMVTYECPWGTVEESLPWACREKGE